MILYMYIAPGQGQKTSWGQTFDVNRKPLSLRPFVASFKQISLNSDFIHIFYIFLHVYSPGAGADNHFYGQNSDVNRKALSLCPFVASFKKYIFEVYFFFTYFCLFLYMYIAPGQGRTTTWGQNIYFNINLLSLWSFAVSFFH